MRGQSGLLEPSTRRGPLFHSLSQHSDWIDIFPVNPQSLARYRQTFYPSRAKDDPVDSQLLEELIRSHPDRNGLWDADRSSDQRRP